jgi:pSer/pThr/pTyr-binding forkhead associated (FHA) protein
MSDRPPDPSPEERLLQAHEQPRRRVIRTPTRKERGLAPPGTPRKTPRRSTRVERHDDSGETTEIVALFRPRQRPPMALLTILDDGREEGDDVRIRRELTVIGRTLGDVLIPHDERVSGRHAEIRRSFDAGRWVWTLADLGSTNGTFVRVQKCALKSGQELMIGHSRFRFESGGLAAGSLAAGSTAAWSVEPDFSPCLVELTSQGDGRRWPLPPDEAWIGRDSRCHVVLEDPVVAARHLHLLRDDRGWRLECPKARDGVWLRIDKPIVVDTKCSFQLGEQRFLLKVL